MGSSCASQKYHGSYDKSDIAAANPYHISLFLDTPRSVGIFADRVQSETVVFLILKWLIMHTILCDYPSRDPAELRGSNGGEDGQYE